MSHKKRNTSSSITHRLLIYSFYSSNGIDTGYRYYFLSKVRDIFDQILVVVNGDIENNTKEKISEVSDEIIIRENRGFDACAYQYVLRDVLHYELSKYEELFLVNDTFYGPFFDLKDVIHEAESKNADLWGMTFYKKDPNSVSGEVQYSHIQSYFLAFRYTIFSKSVFSSFWNNVGCFSNVADVIKNYESVLTHYFADNMGAKYWTYMQELTINFNIGKNPYLTHPYDLIENKFPFLKKKAITPEYIGDPEQSYKVVANIDKLNYPTKLIFDEIVNEYQNPYSGWLYDFSKLREKINNKRIIVYGAGKIGKILGYYFILNNIKEFKYLVTDGENTDNNIMTLSDYKYQKGDVVIIAVMRKTIAKIMYDNIKDRVPVEQIIFPQCDQ